MGTPSYAAPVLSDLVDAGYEVVGVYTQPDRAAGRGRRSVAPPVKLFAQENRLAVFQPKSLRAESARTQVRTLAPDIIVVAAYGLFLPREVLETPPRACLNIHPSLLPKYRGPSPVASAILNGDTVTGVTVMQIDEEMDSGLIVARRQTPIEPVEDAEALTERLFRLGSGLLLEVLPDWSEGRVQAQPQDQADATVTRLLRKEDGEIDWQLSAAAIARQVRAYQPWPGSFTRWEGKLVKILDASSQKDGPRPQGPPGLVIGLADGALGITTGDGVLVVTRLQLEGRSAADAKEFVSGYPGIEGAIVR